MLPPSENVGIYTEKLGNAILSIQSEILIYQWQNVVGFLGGVNSLKTRERSNDLY